jgi:hypothetical protein
MPKRLWTYCFLVSAVLAALMPIVTSIVVIPAEGEEVLDLASIDASQLENMSLEESDGFVDTVPTRKLKGLERFTYQFSHPQFFHFYVRGVAVSFIWLLLATVAVSYLGYRSRGST